MPTDVRFNSGSMAMSYHPKLPWQCQWTLDGEADRGSLNDFDPENHCPLAPLSSSFPCRRVSSFPCLNKLIQPMPQQSSQLRTRSLSESANLDAVWVSMCQITLDDVKKDLASNWQRHVTSCSLATNIGSVQSALSDLCSSQSEKDFNTINDTSSDVGGIPKRSQTWPRGARKAVSFADDKGLPIHTVHQLTESSDMPPSLGSGILRALRALNVEDCELAKATWELMFRQPASEYMRFRQRLEQNCVALENAIVRNDKLKLFGTIKVKNVAFEKLVFIRYSDDGWSSYHDRPAVYVPGTPGDVFETFNFDVDVPFDDDEHTKIEFCVAFRPGNDEKVTAVTYWDSNDGANFTVESARHKPPLVVEVPPPVVPSKSIDNRLIGGQYDAYKLQTHNWGTFSSWHLADESPYY